MRGLGYKWTEGLNKGIYRAELSNDKGTFYRGPDGCVIQFLEQAQMGPFDGGVWIPHDKINDRPRIYYYFNYNRGNAIRAGGIVVAALLEGSVGDLEIMILPTEKTFVDELRVSNLPIATQN